MSEHRTITRERADLLEVLQAHRALLLGTAEGLTDDQARHRSTVSDLTIGGIIKHVADGERGWARFMAGGGLPTADVDWSNPDPAVLQAHQEAMTLLPGETLAEVTASYRSVAAETDRLVAELDLDVDHPLPAAPWFPPGARWSVRRVVAHILAETSQHAGHADVIREAIDGRRSMG